MQIQYSYCFNINSEENLLIKQNLFPNWYGFEVSLATAAWCQLVKIDE